MTLNTKNITLAVRENGETPWKGEQPLFATHCVGTDRYAYEVIEVTAPKTIVVRELKQIPDRENGFEFYGNQVYKFESKPTAPLETLRQRKNGYWYPIGATHLGCPFILTLTPDYYHDPHF